ncbi:MAG: hypothetical protein IIC18_11340, partial [Bacteroidetes bacterium]|nr:hypothetical protein [Bacteroidota bacterium]
GILTDAVGFLGLIPPTRAWIRKRLQARFRNAIEGGNASVFMMQPADPFNQTSSPIEDAEIIEDV